jgi:effector-binding domain-containing protein
MSGSNNSDPPIIDFEPHSGVGIEMPTTWADLRSNIRPLFDRLYKPGALVPGHGHNFIHYANETNDGAVMTVGILDRQSTGADPAIKPFTVPRGRVITVTHWGDFGTMRSTYDKLHAEVKARGLKRIWMSLEIYGDWHDDLTKVRTDLYQYLQVAI